MNDTTPEMHQFQYDLIMSKTPSERFEMGLEMMESGREMMIAGIKAQNPNIEIRGKPQKHIHRRLWFRISFLRICFDFRISNFDATAWRWLVGVAATSVLFYVTAVVWQRVRPNRSGQALNGQIFMRQTIPMSSQYQSVPFQMVMP